MTTYTTDELFAQILNSKTELDAIQADLRSAEDAVKDARRVLEEAQDRRNTIQSVWYRHERELRAIKLAHFESQRLDNEKSAAASENPDRPLYEDLPAYEDVTKAYNGRPGCSCGCMGNYVVPSQEVRQKLNDASTWTPYGIEDVRPRACKMRFKKVMEAAERYMHKCELKATTMIEDCWEYTDRERGVFFTYVVGNYMCVEDETTVNTVYFN